MESKNTMARNPLNTLAGVLRLDKYYGRYWIKVVDHPAFGTRWVLRTHFVWWRYRKQIIPRGWVLHHKDEDSTHDVMSNLALMTRAEHARLHSRKRVWSDESRERARVAAEKRCTSECREAVSARVKVQHKQNNFGRRTWSKEGEASFRKKVGDFHRGKPGGRLGKKATPEQRERYRKAAIKREAKKRKDRNT